MASALPEYGEIILRPRIILPPHWIDALLAASRYPNSNFAPKLLFPTQFDLIVINLYILHSNVIKCTHRTITSHLNAFLPAVHSTQFPDVSIDGADHQIHKFKFFQIKFHFYNKISSNVSLELIFGHFTGFSPLVRCTQFRTRPLDGVHRFRTCGTSSAVQWRISSSKIMNEWNAAG